MPGDLAIIEDIFRRSSLSNAGDRTSLLANPDALKLSGAAVSERRTRVAAYDDGPVVGFASTVMVGDVIELEDLFVDPDWMRRGIGRQLVGAVLALARDRNVQAVEVTGNPHALSFYGRAGFVFVEMVETRFGPAPRMRLALL